MATVLQLPDERIVLNNQQAFVGKDSFIMIKVLTSQTLGSDYRFDGNEEREIITDSVETTVSVNAYGRNANDLLGKLVALLKTSRAMSELRKAKMAIPRVSAVRNLTATVGGGYEERAQLDLTVSHVRRVVTDMTRAETVDITIKKD
jgi:hypothetical protein